MLKTNSQRKGHINNVFLLLFFLCFSFFSFSQTQQITGQVVDESGDPVQAATVRVLGTSNGALTDADGRFLLNVNDGDVIEISFVGYEPLTLTVGQDSFSSLVLLEDVNTLDDVVVVGYTTAKRSEVTGAVTSIDAEEITALPVATADQALQGRAPGVIVINNGSPGTSPTVRVRGLGTVNDNEPLYVIDGVFAQGLGDLNPNDIESVDVLKDPSTTALYGAKGSNGVVIVTTKGGQKGETKISVNSYLGSQYSNDRYDLLNTAQYEQYVNEAWGGAGRFTSPTYDALRGNNTDWQDAIFQSGLIQGHNLAVSGGGLNSNFRISGGYTSQEGAIITSEMERYNLRANSNFNLGKFTFGETFNVAIGDQTPVSNNGGRSVIEHAIKMAPYLPIYDANNLGGYRGPNTSIDGQDAENPVRVLELGERLSSDVNLLGNIFGQFEIVDGLAFKSQVGGEFRNNKFNYFLPSYNDDSEGATSSSDRARITKNTSNLQTVILTNSLTYNTSFNDKHNFNFLALTEKTNTDTEFVNSQSENFISDNINQVGNVNTALTSRVDEYRRLGYLGRVAYNYDGKYLLAGSFRRDASSRFGPSNRWGTFPSLSAGWVISNEDFMADSDITNLKLRASWGKTGNDNIGNYLYQSTISSDINYPFDSGAVGATPSGLASGDLKWEETTMRNIGLDFAFLGGALSGALEFYNNESSDLLIPIQLPISSGFSNGTFIQNIGAMETRGIELNTGYNDYQGEFQWSANLNFGTNKNEVLSLGDNAAIDGGSFENQNISRTVVGESAFQFFGWEFDGIFQNQGDVESHATQQNAAPGDFRIVDQNNDGVIDDNDRTFLGNPFPDFTYGLNLTADYKGFDFNLFFNGVSGNDIYNTNIYDLEGMPRIFNSGVAVLDRWTGQGTSNTVPRAGGAGQNVQTSSRFVEDGSFTRLRNVTIGYDLTDNFMKGKLGNLRVYLSGQNLITITDYSGLDPEVGAYSAFGFGGAPGQVNGQAVQFETGIDRGNYPVPQSITGGIDLTF